MAGPGRIYLIEDQWGIPIAAFTKKYMCKFFLNDRPHWTDEDIKLYTMKEGKAGSAEQVNREFFTKGAPQI